MHVLHLLRHARAAPAGGDADDAPLPLSRAGRSDARLVGESLPAALGSVDLVLCSTALRTRQTASLVLAGFATPPPIAFEDGLYLASSADLLRRLHRLDEAMRVVLVIGHNPGLHELALALAAAKSRGYPALAEGKFPTTTRVSLAIETSWAELDRGRHTVRDYVTPKSLRAAG
jgi:phosphohistidine phosphatase